MGILPNSLLTGPERMMAAGVRPVAYRIPLNINLRAFLVVLLSASTVGVLHAPHAHAIGSVMSYLIMGVFSLLACIVFVTRRYGIPKQAATLSVPWLCLIGVYLLSEAMNPDVHGFVSIAQLVLAFLFFLSCCLIRWDASLIRLIARAMSPYVLAYMVLYAKTRFQGFTDGEQDNYNPAGFVIYCVFLFQLFALVGHPRGYWKAFHITVAVLAFLMHPLSGARSVSLEFLLSALVYAAWPLLTKHVVLYRAALLTLYAAIIAFCLIYVYLGAHAKHFQDIEDQTRVTGGNFFSGRQEMWGVVERLIAQHPAEGNGAGIRLQDISNYDMSTSSLYLQIGLQTGVPGMAMMAWVLYTIWLAFWPGRHTLWARLGASILYGLIFQQSLEVCLTQNQLNVGMLMWMTVAIPLSFVLTRANPHRKPPPRARRRRIADLLLRLKGAGRFVYRRSPGT